MPLRYPVARTTCRQVRPVGLEFAPIISSALFPGCDLLHTRPCFSRVSSSYLLSPEGSVRCARALGSPVEGNRPVAPVAKAVRMRMKRQVPAVTRRCRTGIPGVNQPPINFGRVMGSVILSLETKKNAR